MAHYFESGFTVREPAWHGLGNVLDHHPETWDEARQAAGLMWEPRTVPLYTIDHQDREFTSYDEAQNWAYDNVGDVVGGASFVQRQGDRVIARRDVITVDPNAQRVERDDTGEGIAVVSGGFELITHAQMGEIMETVLDQPNVRFETAGSVKGGRQVYALVLLDEPYEIKGDVDGFGDPVLTLPYFALLNSHDGTGACKGVYTQVRVVCANTVQAASVEGDRHGAQFKLRHTSGVAARIDEARQVIAGARIEALRWKETAEALSIVPITPAQQLEYLDEFIPRPPAEVVSERVRGNVEAERQKFTTLLNDSSTNAAMSDNALGLFNATVEYLDHVRGFRNTDTYLGRQLLRPEVLKTQALGRIRRLTGATV